MSRATREEKPIALRADRLRALREQHGWSQRELARRCGLGEAQINKYESGEIDPTSAYLLTVAQVLGVSTDYLLGVSDYGRGHYEDQSLNEDEQAMINAYRRDGWIGVIHFSADKLAK